MKNVNIIGVAAIMILLLSMFVGLQATASVDPTQDPDGPPYEMVFLHHSSGRNWVQQYLHSAVNNLSWVQLHSAGYREPEQMDAIALYTDVCHWYPKFSNPATLNQIFTFDHSNNVYYSDGRQNDIIMFKSCFPASDIIGYGTSPGNPTDTIKTVWNYKASFIACAAVFAQHPDKLFIPLTTLPRSFWDTQTDPAANMALTREFNNWLKNDYVQWYRATYELNNVAVFDAFDILAWGPQGDHPNYLRYDFLSSLENSHPYYPGNYALTYGYTDPDDGRHLQGFIAFLTQAVDAWQNNSSLYEGVLETHLVSSVVPQQSNIILQVRYTNTGPAGTFELSLDILRMDGTLLIDNLRHAQVSLGSGQSVTCAYIPIYTGNAPLGTYNLRVQADDISGNLLDEKNNLVTII